MGQNEKNLHNNLIAKFISKYPYTLLVEATPPPTTPGGGVG